MNSCASTIAVPPAWRSPMLALSAAGIHRDEDVGVVSGREDVVVGEVDLERRDARQGAGRRPDLGREVGQRRQVVAEVGGLLREPVTGQLHAVAGVTGKTYDDTRELFGRLGRRHRHLPLCALQHTVPMREKNCLGHRNGSRLSGRRPSQGSGSAGRRPRGGAAGSALVELLAPQPARHLVVVLARVARAASRHDVVEGVAAAARDRQHAVALQRAISGAAVGTARPRSRMAIHSIGVRSLSARANGPRGGELPGPDDFG